MTRAKWWLALLLASACAAPALAEDEELEGEEVAEASEGKPRAYRAFVSPKGTFGCDVPAVGWSAMEEDTPLGSTARFFGPVEEGGAWRAALHVHYLDKAQPGFVPIDDAVKRARRSDSTAERSATSVRRARVARASARRFEVNETRLLPIDRLPAAPSALHHYLAFIPAGDGYFIVKLSTSRETYLERKPLFERVLKTFRVLGYN